MPAKKAKPAEGILPELEAAYRFMRENGLEAFELEKGGRRVRLVRAASPRVVPVAVPSAAPAQATLAAPAPAPAAAPPSAPLGPNAISVKAPMMGIFYRAASPSSPPFVKEGDRVKPGDVLCLIEAMKVFNDVKAETPGRIARIGIENGKPVKLGQELFVLERDP